jgi:hypothetical protein
MTTVTAQSSWDLAMLNTFVAQQEASLAGPLTKIGNSGGNTTLEIDTLGGPPAKSAKITTGAVPTEGTVINADKVYISNVLMAATAYR